MTPGLLAFHDAWDPGLASCRSCLCQVEGPAYLFILLSFILRVRMGNSFLNVCPLAATTCISALSLWSFWLNSNPNGSLPEG